MTDHLPSAGIAALSIVLLAACGADEESIDNLPPVTDYSVDVDGDPLIRIDARASSDEDGFVVAWTFDYGDGSPTEYSSSPAAIHNYATNGSYTLTVSAIDDLGAKSSLSNTVVITRATGVAPPGADAGGADVGAADAISVDIGLTPGDAGTPDELDGSASSDGDDATTAIDAGPAPTPVPPEPIPTPDAG